MNIDRRRLFALGGSAIVAAAVPPAALAVATPAPAASGAALSLTMEEFAKRIIEPAMQRLAAQIEDDAFLAYPDFLEAA